MGQLVQRAPKFGVPEEESEQKMDEITKISEIPNRSSSVNAWDNHLESEYSVLRRADKSAEFTPSVSRVMPVTSRKFGSKNLKDTLRAVPQNATVMEGCLVVGKPNIKVSITFKD